MIRRFTFAMVALALAVPMLGQPRSSGAGPGFRSEIQVHWYQFGNFFQASEAPLVRDVNAVGGEYRLAWRPRQSPTDLYAHVDYLDYSRIDRPSSWGGRLGVAHFGEVHQANAYVDRASNRASFDVGDVTATADITTFAADYSVRVTPDWQLGAEALVERQRFDNLEGRDNDYRGIGGSVRYRGFGRLVSPEIGYVRGERDTDDPAEGYDDSYWFARLIVAPTDRLYTTIRYRGRTRDYAVPDPGASNFGRIDDRAQWSASAVYDFTDRLGGMLYYAREDVDSSRVGRDFDTDLLMLGIRVGF